MNPVSMRFVARFAELLTTSLIHFVWQGAVLTLGLILFVRLFSIRTARQRYLLSVTTLFLMGIAPVLTAVWFLNANLTTKHSHAGASNQTKIVVEDPIPLVAEQIEPLTADHPEDIQAVVSTSPVSGTLDVYVLVAWLAGVLILSTRLTVSYCLTIWIRQKLTPMAGEFERRIQLLGKRLAVDARNRVFTSMRVGQAVAVGFIRPIVLIPVAWLTELTPEMIEAVIAHELTHIRRLDLWVNLAQRVVETLLFYHPAVWWLSHRIRLEREMCCDEIAAGCFDRVLYARSLETVAMISHGNLLMAASINDGNRMNLLKRVQYLLGAAPNETCSNWWAAGMVAIILPFAVGVVASMASLTTTTVAIADDPTSGRIEGKVAGDRRELAPGIFFRWCPPGKFKMGETTLIDHPPPVDVQLTKGFWLGETEVTQGQWQSLMKTTPWSGNEYVKEGPDYAVNFVSHDDAVIFCKKLTAQEQEAGRLPKGWTYSLPTSAQWEYGCRAGTTTKYSFGDDASKLSEYAWWGGFIWGGNASAELYAHQVGLKKPNTWGLNDMHGNVEEFCSDWCVDELQGGTDPIGPATGEQRVSRGGCWMNGPEGFRCGYEGGFAPSFFSRRLGFRLCVRTRDIPSVRGEALGGVNDREGVVIRVPPPIRHQLSVELACLGGSTTDQRRFFSIGSFPAGSRSVPEWEISRDHFQNDRSSVR